MHPAEHLKEVQNQIDQHGVQPQATQFPPEGDGHNAPPEFLMKGKYDSKFDIFSLGIVVYQMIKNTSPFETPRKRGGKMLYHPPKASTHSLERS